MKMRIAKFIAQTGAASRRDAERLVESGAVTVNGAVVNTPVFFVDDGDAVAINGAQIQKKDAPQLYMFHKPVNVMTTARDPMGRRTVYDCLPEKYKNLKYVGRLDFKTSGLLLMTNDGELARRLTLPASGIRRTYIATVGGRDLSGIDRARAGVTAGGVRYRPMEIDVVGDNVLRVTVTEGKKNEIRIVLRECGAPVLKLHREKFGNIELGDLPRGKIIAVPQKTVDALIKSL